MSDPAPGARRPRPGTINPRRRSGRRSGNPMAGGPTEHRLRRPGHRTASRTIAERQRDPLAIAVAAQPPAVAPPARLLRTARVVLFPGPGPSPPFLRRAVGGIAPPGPPPPPHSRSLSRPGLVGFPGVPGPGPGGAASRVHLAATDGWVSIADPATTPRSPRSGRTPTPRPRARSTSTSSASATSPA